MANFDQLKQSVAALIRTNGAEEITGQIMQDVLLTIINSISGGYMFGGVAQHNGNVGNPDYNVFYLAGSGAYTGYGGAITIEAGCYGVFRYNGVWTQEVVDIGVRLSGSIAEGETRGVTGDVINTALQTLFENVMNILDTLTFSYNTPSGQQATKAILDVIMTPTGGASHVFATLTLASATVAAAGLMSAEDKQKVDRMLTDFRSLSLTDTTAAADQATKIVQTLSATLGENPEAITTFTLLAATASKAGLMSAADKAMLDCLVAMVGYYTCDTAAGTAAKTVSASGYSLTNGGCIRVKMTNANTANNVTLNINSTGAKSLYYDGAQASSTNSWEAGEVLEVYYDGTQYQCASGGGGKFATGEKVKDTSISNVLQDNDDLVTGKTVYKEIMKENDVDLSKYPIINGYYINNNSWKQNNDTSYMLIPVSDVESDSILVKATSESKCYIAFLTSNIVPTVPVQFATGTQLTIIDEDNEHTFSIPDDATYIYLMASYLTTSRLPQSVVYNISIKDELSRQQDEIDEHSDQLEELKISNTSLDLSSFTRKAGCPQGATDWIVLDKRSHIDIPVQAGETYKICANSNFESLFVLLKHEQTPTNHLPYDLATGETGYRKIPVSSCGIVKIPSDCTCMSVGCDGSTQSVIRDYTPSSIEKMSIFNALQAEIDETNEKIASYHSEPTKATLTPVSWYINSRLVCYTDESGYYVSISPNQKFKVVGSSSFVYLKSLNVQSGSACDASEYWSGYNTINYNITTTDVNVLYAAPDANYIFFKSLVEVYLYDEYNTYQRNQLQYTDMLKYMMNKSCQYVIHQYLRTTHPGVTTFTVKGDEQSYRGCAACAQALAGIYSLGIMDLSVIGTSMSNIIWQAKRMLLSAAASYNNWKERWESSLAATKYGNAAYMLKDFLTTSEYNSILACVESEANALITKVVGTRWNDNVIFGLYWKNSDDSTNFNGDSKSEEVGWYSGCLATAIFLMPDNVNVESWKSKLVEWSVISYSSPSSKTSGIAYNGYELSNLAGYNITDDGLVVNHNRIHPDYMASRTSCLFDGFAMWIKEGQCIPKAAQCNMDKIYYGYTEREFVEGEPNVVPPYGTIYKIGANDLYYPQGNDWGSVRFYSLAEYAGYIYSLCLHPQDDTSRVSSILWAHVKQLQDRFKTGAVHKEDGSENSYPGREPSMANEIFGQLIIEMYPVFWTDEDWYTTP